jgi:thiol-disulfide isomerase/thioredoxin
MTSSPRATGAKGYGPLLVLAVVLALVIVIVAVWPEGAGPPPPVAAEIGATAPEITASRLENGAAGPTVTLSELRGRPVIVNFWATWCEPCRTEFPALDTVYRKYRQDNQLEVVAVNVQDPAEPEALQSFLGEMGVIFPVWLGSGTGIDRTYNVQAMPTTVFIDRSGVIRHIRIGGPLDREYLEQELSKIF